jgi:acetyltransferase-like isoleucine patch superfamily enzyme
VVGAIILSLLPSFIQVPVRRLLGQRIGKKTKIRFGTILKSSSVSIGDSVSIGPFCYIKAEKLEVGNKSQIKPLAFLSTRVIKLAEYVHLAPFSIISGEFTENSGINLGDHVRIFPFCWLDAGEGIEIGEQTGMGAYSTIYTHGVWSDYLQGGPVEYGPVVIKDNVWIPSKVTILPNVVIGDNTIIGTNSVVNKSFGNNLLIGGTPAKIIRENVNAGLSPETKKARINEILSSFASTQHTKGK